MRDPDVLGRRAFVLVVSCHCTLPFRPAICDCRCPSVRPIVGLGCTPITLSDRILPTALASRRCSDDALVLDRPCALGNRLRQLADEPDACSTARADTRSTAAGRSGADRRSGVSTADHRVRGRSRVLPPDRVQ